MKILLIHDVKKPFGGGEKFVEDIEILLKSYGNIVYKYYGSEQEDCSVFGAISKFYNLKQKKILKKIITKFSPDIVISNGTNRVITESIDRFLYKNKIYHIKIIHSYSYFCPKTWAIFKNGKPCNKGYNVLCLIYKCKSYKKGINHILYYMLKWLKVGLHRITMKNFVNHFICPSAFLAECMKKSLKLSDTKVTFLPHFIAIDKNSYINFNNINPKQFLFVGRISSEKGIDIAIKAIALLKKWGIQDAVLKIIGDGSERGILQKLVIRLQVINQIRFIGFIPNSQIDKYYQDSIAVIVPSVWMETFGLINIEAMKNKTPVIASNIGAMQDIVEHGTTGYLFEMGNYIELAKYMRKLYNNKKLSIKLGEAGYAKVLKEFNKENYYKKLMEICRRHQE
jgi:glycosyltransferase involved in cell wall biosynthesis